MSSLVGIILAGGSSRRMGRDKAALMVDGITMLDHMQKILIKSGAEKIVILGRPDHPNGIADPCPGAGPADALYNYLTESPKGQRNIIVPIDMPALTPKVLMQLMRQGLWAHYEKNYLPLFAISGPLKYPDNARLSSLISMLDIAILPLSKQKHEQFCNLNFHSDWQGWRTQRSGKVQQTEQSLCLL
jgi:molybdopterin-guanine dinucleotide biosynthesis protein A